MAENFQERLEPMGLSFPIPADTAFRVQLPAAKIDHLFLFALSSINQGMGSMVASADDLVPTTASVPVDATEAGIVLAAAPSKARRVSIANSGANDLIILEGAEAPGFSGQPNPQGAGNLAADYGIVIKPGGLYETPVAHKGVIRGRTRTGQTTTATVTRF